MMNNQQAQSMVEEEIQALYQVLKLGLDVSPGQQIRFEGKVDLLLKLKLIEWEWLEAYISTQYEHYFNQHLLPDYWEWMHSENHFVLPIKMWDAPVYKY